MSSKTGLPQSQLLFILLAKNLNNLQSSKLPSSNVWANALAVPSDLSDTEVNLSHIATGLTLSSTVTFIVHVVLFSHSSYTLKVISLVPLDKVTVWAVVIFCKNPPGNDKS